MRFSVLAEFFCGFAVLDDFLFGFAVSNTPPMFQCKFPIFYSTLACSFGRDHSELDISRKDDGDAHSIKETLQNLSTYMSINTSYS